MENQDKKNYLLPASILIAAALVAGALIYSTGAKNTNPEKQGASLQEAVQGLGKPQIGDDVILGDPEAPVTVFIYSDYQCPFCGKFFQETESLIRKNYVDTGKVKLVYKGLSFLGPESTAAAQAAECAKDQKKYWQYHDALFKTEYVEVEKVIKGEMETNENNGNLNRELFKKIASDLGMNVDEFLSCFDSQKYASEVEQNAKEANAVMGGRVSTPTIFINDLMIQGAYPYDAFAQAIDEALSKK